ncbi:MAG: response regulator [Verrucomicrobia bacterium]|nr:response regulator [Verrucomicrobiota bacterium]
MPAIQRSKAMSILLVEDNPGDVQLTREALKENDFQNTLNVVQDGEDALRFLRGEEPYIGVALPDLILLDLNLPRKDGREVLADIKTDQKLRRIPVVVLTTSTDEKDISQTYDLHVNCYVTKPINFDRFIEVVRTIENYWLSVVELPPSS